ncbi:hypothetical protein CVD28_03130 [Bacillus sp. M6-12]|uniref:hypothetical protein n=1 Tax=Bacillus sp. M6-12 TaxID=2054166 RepID=UPI000C77F859|nr:hypothetical protein [Bacillus sp. M6-12]PLS19423.1 hypothetical protein CVD28_03130 [Bacillus sp. M6-12]
MRELNEGMEKVKNQIEKAHNPTPIHKQVITAHDLKELGDNEQIVIHHPLITGIILKIRKEFKVETMLNIPVVFYGEKYVIEDSGDKVFPQHEVLFNEEEMVAYVEKLLSCKNKELLYYLRSLARKELEVGNVIEFEDGKKGVIVIPEGFIGRNPMFVPLKKDGTKSNHKPRYIYANDSFKKINEELEG